MSAILKQARWYWLPGSYAGSIGRPLSNEAQANREMVSRWSSGKRVQLTSPLENGQH